MSHYSLRFLTGPVSTYIPLTWAGNPSAEQDLFPDLTGCRY
jgi:hypothetical protein